MAGFSNVGDVLHKIKVKLYPNYLPTTEGRFIARTDNDSSLGIEQICASLKNRGGFAGNYDNLVENVRQFLDEMVFLVCDGFAVNTGYYSIYPNIGGTFNSSNELHDHAKHPISFRFRTMAKLRQLISRIAIEIEGMADTSGYIDEFFDYDEHQTNAMFVSGDMFSISGYKIKIAGDDPSCGLYFVPVDDPSKAVKVTRLAENSPAKLIGIAPKAESARYSIVIRTQYAGSGTILLKTPRVITSTFILEAA